MQKPNLYIDSRIVLPRLNKPLTFGGLMAVYESNYVQFMHLLKADRNQLEFGKISFRYDDHQVVCRVEDVTKYTTLVCIDEDQFDDGEPVRINHFRIRLYHDALLAAVQSSTQSTSEYKLESVPVKKGRLKLLWQQNMFFNKWLDFCDTRTLVFEQKIDENT